jgi:hypothetical protein
MNLYDIFESAESDILSLRKAEMICYKFFKWMHDNNEEKPIKMIMGRKTLHAKNHDFKVYAVSALELGLPQEYKDLFIGLGPSYDSSRNIKAYITTAIYTDGIEYTVVFVPKPSIKLEDIADETELIWKTSDSHRSSIVHELIHYFDAKRQKTSDRNAPYGFSSPKLKNNTEYFNSPKEFNAFFQQGMHSVMKELIIDKSIGAKRKLRTFEDFKKNFLIDFREDFRNHMTAETKKRFDKRLYKLWEWLKEKYPNIMDTGQLMSEGLTEGLNDTKGGFWITENGEILECDHEQNLHHADIALKHFDLDDGEEHEDDGWEVKNMALEAAVDNGWIQVSTWANYMSLNWLYPSDDAKKTLLSWVGKYGKLFEKGMYIQNKFGNNSFDNPKKYLAIVKAELNR